MHDEIAIIENVAQVKIGGKQTYKVNSEYARWYDECTSKPGTYPAKLCIPTSPYDTALPYVVVKWDGIITSCNWQTCFGGVPVGEGTDTRGKAMTGFTRIELVKALKDKRVTWANVRSILEMTEQRCQECLARLVERMSDKIKEGGDIHGVSYYADLIKNVASTIEAIQSTRRQAIYDENKVA